MNANSASGTELNTVSPAAWQQVAGKRIYFGHQSVGGNIVAGIEQVLRENPQIKLNIAETTDPAKFKAPIFAHSKVGHNEQPATKNADFAKVVGSKLKGDVDVAFFKYCYVDVTRRTDAAQLFADYKRNMDKLKAENPRTTFVHVTAPLTVIQTGPRAWLKRALGKPIGGYDDNKKRHEFNEMLRKEYGGNEPIFDLAQVESTLPNGARVTYEYNGATYHGLAPEYSDDGGHLNERGQKVVAEKLLLFLTQVASKPA